MSEKILRKALEKAHSRLGLIFTAEERDFRMGYIQGYAKAGCEEIEAALTASPILEEPGFQEALVSIAEHVISRWHQTALRDARLPSLIAELDYCKDKVKEALAASPAAPVEGELRTVVHAEWCKHGPELMSAHGGYIRHPNYPCICDAVHAGKCKEESHE